MTKQNKKQYDKLRYLNNKQNVIKKAKEWYFKNKKRKQKTDKIWRAKTRQKRLKQLKLWYKNNKEQHYKSWLEYAKRSGTYTWRYSTEYKNWRTKVKKRDNYTCQQCGITHCKIIAHHIKPAKDYPELRYDVSNGMCLCESCHKQIHFGTKILKKF